MTLRTMRVRLARLESLHGVNRVKKVWLALFGSEEQIEGLINVYSSGFCIKFANGSRSKLLEAATRTLVARIDMPFSQISTTADCLTDEELKQVTMDNFTPFYNCLKHAQGRSNGQRKK